MRKIKIDINYKIRIYIMYNNKLPDKIRANFNLYVANNIFVLYDNFVLNKKFFCVFYIFII